MSRCPTDLLTAAAEDRLGEDQVAKLQSHLSRCKKCCENLEKATAPPRWWSDAARLLDDSILDDPAADDSDSSAADARLFEGDDPVGELKAAGVIDSSSTHPEVLGMLGRYTIEREIGSGGMGVVLKGFDAELNRTVAIKVLAPHLARSAAARQRFIREGRAAAAVVHENIVSIHEVDTSGRLPTLVMHFVDGVSLQRHVDTIGPLPVTDALRIAAQCAAGLDAAHRQGIVHRDVKPANILINGGGQRVWITDFGLARAVDDASLTRTGFIAGTPHYMSPEQARGGSIGPQSDLFSLGSVIYFMLAARPPWRAERSLAVLHRIVQEPHRPLWQINPDVPREVSDLVDLLLSKLPQERIDSAATVQKELEDMLSKMQNPASPHALSSSTAVPTIRRFYSRPWFLVPMTALVTLLCVWLFHEFSETTGMVVIEKRLGAEPGIGVASEYETSSRVIPQRSSTKSNLRANAKQSGPAIAVTNHAFGTAPKLEARKSSNALRSPTTELGRMTFGTASKPVGSFSLPSKVDKPRPNKATEQWAEPKQYETNSTISDDTWAKIYEVETLLSQAESLLTPSKSDRSEGVSRY